MLRSIIAMTLATLSGAALAASPPAQPDAASAETRKICRTDEVTGSHMSHRACHTKAEWAEIDRRNASITRQFVTDRDAGAAANGRMQ